MKFEYERTIQTQVGMSLFNFQAQYEEAMRRAGIEVSYYPTQKPGLPGRYDDYKRAIQYRSPAYISQLPQEKIDVFEKELHELIVQGYEKVLEEEEQAFYRRRFDERLDAEVREIQAIRKEVEEKRKQKKKELQAAVEAIDEALKNEGFKWFTRTIGSGSGRYTYYTNWGTSYLDPWVSGGEEKFNDLDALEKHVQEFQRKLAEYNRFKDQEASAIVAKIIEQQVANYWDKSDEDILQSMKEAEANGHNHFLWPIHNPFSSEPFESPTLWKQIVLTEVWSKPAQEEMAKFRAYSETLYKRNKDKPLLSVATARIQELEQQLNAEKVRNDRLESKMSRFREVLSTI